MTDSQKLDLLLSKMVLIESTMATKDDVQRLDDKVNVLDDKVNVLDNKIDNTKQDLILCMDDMQNNILNTCLGYTDAQDESIITKLENIQSTVNTATRLKTIDNDVYNLVNQRIDELTERVDKLAKIS
ncbi:MAG: hypothetical protein RR681_04325 [Lachnospiraceae bacterium]